MQVIAAGEAGHPALAERLSFRHRVANVHPDRRQMSVEGGHAHAVIDDDTVSINAEPGCVQDLAGIGCCDRDAGGRREVEPEVYLLIDFLAAVEIRSMIRKARLDL